MSGRLILTIGLLMGLAPATAQAQTNIDQGKSPSQIFANDCAACHKSTKGLANGKNSMMLGAFLREHYTASREQAAALAAYVLGGGGGESGTAAQGRGQKPGQEHARTPAEESKPAVRQARQPAKPEEEGPGSVKPKRPNDEAARPDDEASPGEEPSIVGPAKREARPTTAARGRRRPEKEEKEEAAPVHEPTTVIAAPAVTEMPSQSAVSTPTAAAPAEAEPESGAPVPRDNIPD